MIGKKEIIVTTMDGEERKYLISKVPAVQGREIFTQYVPSAMPKIGDYAENEKLMFKLMSYVAVDQGEAGPLKLENRALIDNHVPDWETQLKIEKEMIEYNTSFFGRGKNSSSLETFLSKALQSATKTLMDSLLASLQAAKQRSKN